MKPSELLRQNRLEIRRIGARNALSHGYFKVDLEVVWKTVQEDLPALNKAVDEILVEISS